MEYKLKENVSSLYQEGELKNIYVMYVLEEGEGIKYYNENNIFL